MAKELLEMLKMLDVKEGDNIVLMHPDIGSIDAMSLSWAQNDNGSKTIILESW